ncbi:efflux RND transporter periplasmic adaptor subunit [Sphingomonas sp. ID0503]|uniref:efflux RND transporter periplasmic adaptor subunit n=1 Tax=Sphingomonas sp. ID0503 TaxID=3399691 RepID=UPI003AFB1A45
MRSQRRLGLSGLAFLSLLGACGQEAPPPPPPPKVGVITLKSEPVTLTRELPGRISALETSEVRPQVSGVIRRRLFEEGAEVRAGQVLYEIEDAPYRAALGTAQGQLQRAQAGINASQRQAQRYGELAAINAVSRQEAENATASAGQARADVAAQRAAVESARINLGFTRVRAPISGRIGRSLVTPGALVQNGQADPLATIQRLDSVYVDVTQSAAELVDLRQSIARGALTRNGPDSARVQLMLPNGTTYPIEGRLQFSEVTVDQTTGAVALRATFPNPDKILLPGMYVRARLVEGIRTNGVLVPQQGITRNERGEATAMVVGADNKVEQRTVTTDRAVGGKWLVSAGLKPGDRVIVEGLVMLTPGTKVDPGPPSQVTAPQKGKAPAPVPAKN